MDKAPVHGSRRGRRSSRRGAGVCVGGSRRHHPDRTAEVGADRSSRHGVEGSVNCTVVESVSGSGCRCGAGELRLESG